MLKTIPTIPKSVNSLPTKHRKQKTIEEVRPQIKLYALMQNIEQYQEDKEELLNIIRLINETRHCSLVNHQLLALLGIEAKTDPNKFTCEELVKIVIFLHDAVIAREKPFINATIFELWYEPTLHVTHYHSPDSPVGADGVSPTYVHTISKGFPDKESAEAMVAFLYTTFAMEEYGVKAIGYRTEGKHTRCPVEIKIWCSHTRWQQQNQLLNLLAEEEGEEGRTD